jgi:uncharacterized protein (DUF2267 family)
MQYEDFIQQVMEKTPIHARENAEELVKGTLETLGERLYRTERAKISAQLSADLKNLLEEKGEPGPTRRHVDRFTAEEFYNRISARTGMGLPEVRRSVPGILAVLSEAVSPAVIEDAVSDLPEDFRKLFGG